jgi:hypothetical protein
MIILATVLAAIGITVIATLNTSMPSLTGTAQMANTTLYGITSAAYNGLSLWTILPVVLIAAVIIALIIGSFMTLRASGAAE